MIPFPHKSEFNNAAQRAGQGIDSALDAAGHTALHINVRKGDVETVTRLLHLRANPLQPDKQGQTALYEAIATQNLAMVSLLLEAGATFRTEDDHKRTPLMWAIEQRCDVAFLEQLRALGMTLDFTNKAGRQALHTAAIVNNPDAIEYLVKNGVSADLADRDGKTALHLAVEGKAHDSVRQLLGAGADPLIRTKEIKTPLHIAAAAGDETTVDILLELPAVKQTVNEFQTYAEGFTPLMTAVHTNQIAVAAKLIGIGADLNQRDNQNRHSLYIAVETGHPGMAELLIREGADVEKGPRAAGNTTPMLHKINVSRYNEILQMLYAAGANVDVVDANGLSALHKACGAASDGDKARALLELGADPNLADAQGRRPIDAAMAIASYYNPKVHDTVRLLLEYRADPNMPPSAALQYAPLHLAARSGKKEFVSLLLEHDANLEEPDRREGLTPLMLAVEQRNQDALDMLRQKGADLFAKDHQGRGVLHLTATQWTKDFLEKLLLIPALLPQVSTGDAAGLTPLHHACRAQRSENAETLLRAGANAAAYDAAGMTPLHHAVQGHNIGLLTAFDTTLGKKANWNVQNRIDGDTPLHIAARRGSVPLVERLLSLGADPSVKNKSGASPLEVALDLKQVATAGLLTAAIQKKEKPATSPAAKQPPFQP